MAFVLPHLHSGWAVDQAIVEEQERLVTIRFGRDWSKECMIMDACLAKIANKVKNFCVIYLVDIDEVPDFNKMYELYDPVSLMFFFRNKHMQIDLGTGNNNKVNWPISDKQECIDIIETVYKAYIKNYRINGILPQYFSIKTNQLGSRKGRGLVISPKDYSTKYRY